MSSLKQQAVSIQKAMASVPATTITPSKAPTQTNPGENQKGRSVGLPSV